jgi:hypothetical protein
LNVLKEKRFTSPVVVEISNLFTGLNEREVTAQAVAYLVSRSNT